jgi:hypothetical protein
MLQRLGEHISNALKHAEEAEKRAARATDPALRADNETMARSWRMVARSFEFAESLERFLLDSQKHRDLLPPKPPDNE